MVESCTAKNNGRNQVVSTSTSFLSFLVFDQLLLQVASYFIASFANTTTL